jgi:hypothetical protein
LNFFHLADALDGWKNWALGLLCAPEPITVVPMFTDANAWDDCHRVLYARLLHSDSDHLVNAQIQFIDATRVGYFDDAAKQLFGAKIVFVDPDNGPWTNRGPRRKGREKYVMASELVQLLGDEPTRVVITYRHESRNQNIEGLTTYISQLFANSTNIASFGLLCGVTSLLFMSRSCQRIEEIRNQFAAELNPMDQSRITRVLNTR